MMDLPLNNDKPFTIVTQVYVMGDVDHAKSIFGKVWKATFGVEIWFDNLKFWFKLGLLFGRNKHVCN